MVFNFIFTFPQTLGLNDIEVSFDETSIVNNYLLFNGPSFYKLQNKPHFLGWKIIRTEGDLPLVFAGNILTKNNRFIFDASNVTSSKASYTTKIYCDIVWSLAIGFDLQWGTFEENNSSSQYQVVTVQFDVDPVSGGNIFDITGVYSNLATNFTPGSSDWDNYFGIYPVLLKDGKEIVKLSPDDYTKDLNGNDVDITSGLAGDVMIAFPKRGLRMRQNANILEISFTTDPNDSSYEYYAHNQDVFYVGAYQGFIDDEGKLRSLSGKAPTTNKTIGDFRTAAHLNGTGYEQFAFYQLVYLQAVYSIKYNCLNGSKTLGNGYVQHNGSLRSSGLLNQQGYNFGNPSSDVDGLKFMGIEHFWGNAAQFIDGIVTDSNGDYLIGTNNYNDTGDGYLYKYFHDPARGFVGHSSLCGKVIGTSVGGFAPIDDTYGTSSHYFCDSVSCYPSSVAYFGAGKSLGGITSEGPYALNLNITSIEEANNIGSRLIKV